MDNISTPTLLLDEQVCRANISRMVRKANEHQLNFRPHMKTHQSAAVGEWLREEGVQSITVSSVSMARYFAQNGWKDITIAFPCNLREAKAINDLAGEIRLTVLINSAETARQLNRALSHRVHACIELDIGSGRTGLSPSNTEAISKLIHIIRNETNRIELAGFYSHPGHSYGARSKQEILKVHQNTLTQIDNLKEALSDDWDALDVCIGDTPCCSVATDFTGIDAISPGNFIFYDLMQQQIGSCRTEDIAVAVACPVVELFPERNEIAIYGGAVHFSKEGLQLPETQGVCFGYVAQKTTAGWAVPDRSTFLRKISQEHGIVSCRPEDFNTYSVGDLITILPVHSCLTANLLGQFCLQDGRMIPMR